MSFYAYLIPILFITFGGCKQFSDEKSSLNARVTIDLRATKTADLGQPGAGEFLISSNKAIKAQCTNCGSQLSLSFQSEDEGFTQKAVFQFPYVEKTYLCKLNFRVTFDDDSKEEQIAYGLYLCPIAINGDRQCDLENAMETCRLN